MNRSVPLLRTTPLVTRSGLARTIPLARAGGLSRSARTSLAASSAGRRRKGLAPRSKKTAALYVTRRALVAAMLAEFPQCQIRWDENCQGRSAEVHEPGKRSQGADICDPAQCVATCAHCHSSTHASVAEAERRGWLIRSGRPSKATPRRSVTT